MYVVELTCQRLHPPRPVWCRYTRGGSLQCRIFMPCGFPCLSDACELCALWRRPCWSCHSLQQPKPTTGKPWCKTARRGGTSCRRLSPSSIGARPVSTTTPGKRGLLALATATETTPRWCPPRRASTCGINSRSTTSRRSRRRCLPWITTTGTWPTSTAWKSAGAIAETPGSLWRGTRHFL